MSKKNNPTSPKAPSVASNLKKENLTIFLPKGKENTPAWLTDLLAKNQDRLSVLPFQAQCPSEAKGFVWFADAKTLDNQAVAEAAISKFLQSSVDSGAAYMACLPKSQTKGFMSWLNAIPSRLFSGIDIAHAVHELVFFPFSFFSENYSLESYWGQNNVAVSRAVIKAGKTVSGLEVNSIEKHKQGFVKGLLLGILGFFSLLFAEFVKIPLSQKFSIPAILQNKNHPFYKFKFFVLALLGLLVMLYVSKDYNVTWDEETNQESGTLAYNYLSTFGSDTTIFNFNEGRNRYTNQHYGMSFDVMAVAVQKWMPNTNIYAVRHFLNTIVGFLIVLFTGLIAWRLVDIRAGILAMFLLFFSPSFIGHAFNNPKDIPFALGFVMGIFYLSRFILEWPKPRLQTRVMLAVGLGYCLSIRAGGLLLFAITVMFIGLLWILHLKKSKSVMPYLKLGLPVLVLGYFLGIILWPYALRSPIDGPLKALKEFENFSHLTYYELYDGVRMYLKPWHYIPKLIAITAPLVALLGLGMLLMPALRNTWTKSQKLVFALLLFSSVFPVAYTIYKGSYLYNGWRHMLFVYPGLVVLAAAGWSYTMGMFKNKVFTSLIMALFLGLSARVVIWSAQNHPYQYMYFNELVGGVKGANGNYELDYWNQTPRAAMQWLHSNVKGMGEGKIPMNSNNPIETLTTFNPGTDSMQYRWTREYEWTKNNWEYAIWTHRTLNKNQIRGDYWPPKGTVHTIEVAGVPVCAVVKRPSMHGFFGHKALESRNFDSAVWYFQKAIELEPFEEEYYRGLAFAFRNKGNIEMAEENYLKALEIRDGNYEALHGLGEITLNRAVENAENPNQDLLAKASKYFKETVFYKKNYTSAYYYLGTLELNKNDLESAMKTYRTALEVNPNAYFAYQGIGKVFISLNQADSALYYLDFANQIEPRQADIYLDIAKAFNLKGDTQNAQRYQQEYMQRMQGGGQ